MGFLCPKAGDINNKFKESYCSGRDTICRHNLDLLSEQTKLLNKRNPYLTSVAYYLDSGNCNPHYLVPNCSAINLEYITRNMVKIKQLCLSIGSAKYRGGMVPKVALSYH